MTDVENPDFHDLTDGAGHGLLVATDNIWLTCYATAATADAGENAVLNVATVNADLIYRFKEVSLQEYIGIVQSQQSS